MTKTYASPTAPPTSSSIAFRQFLSFPIIVLLWTAAVPFSPVAWVTGPIEGALLFDRFVAGIILLCALYFQFKASGLSHPVAITLSNPFAQNSDAYVSNGRMGRSSDTQKSAEIVFIYQPSNYFVYTAAEVALLLVAEFAGSEYVRRGLVLGVLSALWMVGWCITPRATKRWAWEHIKAFWFFIVLDLIRDVGFGGGRRRARR